MKPYGVFLAIHFEVGRDTKNLEHQKVYWPAAIDLIHLADQYGSGLTLQFSPQWAEYILKDKQRHELVRSWQAHGHEVSLHHHGYDHGDWNGYTNRTDKEHDPRFRGNIPDMMKLMSRLVCPHRALSGTITDEIFDYPPGIRYDTEGILISHARSKPKWVTLGPNNRVIQVGMAFLSFESNIDNFKYEYEKSRKDEVFGVVTHEKDFTENPAIIEEWLNFTKSKGKTIRNIKEIITDYQKKYIIGHNDNPLIFVKNVIGAVK